MMTTVCASQTMHDRLVSANEAVAKFAPGHHIEETGVSGHFEWSLVRTKTGHVLYTRVSFGAICSLSLNRRAYRQRRTANRTAGAKRGQ